MRLFFAVLLAVVLILVALCSTIVGADQSPWDYDSNRDARIEKPEVIRALQDYFGLLITKAQTIQILSLYFTATGMNEPPGNISLVVAAHAL
jgi:hypothetical protein